MSIFYHMATQIDVQQTLSDLEARLAATRAQLRDAATMGAVIAGIHEIDAVLSVFMEMSLRLVDGEVGLIMLEQGGTLMPDTSWGLNADVVSLLSRNYGRDPTQECYASGKPIVLNGLGIKAASGLSIDAALCLPIQTVDHRHGVLLIVNKAEGVGFTDQDLDSLAMLVNFVAVAIDNSNLIRDRLRQQKVAQEMAIARQIQETILPQDITSIPGVEIGVVYSPAREVGGDFYDVFKLNDHRFVVVIGDVSNKGVPAALVMSAASGIISSLLSTNPEVSVADLAGRLNTLLVNEVIKDREMFVTLFFCKFDLRDKRLTYCNAGHLPGLLWSAADRDIAELATGGPIVGQFSDLTFSQGERRLGSGDRLLLFTDGLTEATDANNNLFGRRRLEQLLADEVMLPPQEFCRTVKERIDQFGLKAPEESRDDFTLLQVKVR